MRRIVITGMGIISSLGNDVDTVWNNLVNGRSGITSLDTIDVSSIKTKSGDCP